ncbi:MAG: MarR family transcriptional regulator [Pseudomonadota bacterium]
MTIDPSASTAQKIANLLNREEMTVNELAVELGISRNSVHQQIGKLEAAGVVRKAERRHSTSAGKPSFCYRTVAGSEDAFSHAYKPVLTALIGTISAQQNEHDRTTLLEQAGQTLAEAADLSPSGELRADVQRSVDAVNSLGAMAELRLCDDSPYVSCHTCPVASLVHVEPLVCRLVASFFSSATGTRVAVRCRHDGAVVCGFSFDEG